MASTAKPLIVNSNKGAIIFMQDQKPTQPPTQQPGANPPAPPAMPKPLSPLNPVDAPKPVEDIEPATEKELLAVLEKSNKNKEPILSKFPSLQAGLPQAGHVVSPSSPTPAGASPVPAQPPTVKPAPLPPSISELAPKTPAAAVVAPTLPPISDVSLPDSGKTTLTPEDSPAAAKPESKPARHLSLPHLFNSRSRLFIPLFILAASFVLLAAPWTRYQLAGLFIDKSMTIRVMDATTGMPVSNAEVSAGSIKSLTDGRGQATLTKVNPGYMNLIVAKQNYTSQQARTLVPILNQKQLPVVKLLTTGNLVEISVKNLISGKSLDNVSIETADVSAKTDPAGNALIALSNSGTAASTTFSLAGYNDKIIDLKSTAGEIVKSEISLTPAGRAYYLAQSTAGVNVISANLDGTEAKTVLAGSSYENTSTKLLRSPSGQYLALLSRRTADPHNQLYIIDTLTSKMAEADFGPAAFNIYGWIGDSIVYSLTYDNIKTWQDGKNLLKSYDAAAQKPYVLSKSLGSGNSTSSAYQEYSGVMLTDQLLAYGLSWQTAGRLDTQLNGKSHELIVSSAQGSDSRKAASYDAAKFIITYNQHSPRSMYIQRTSVSGGSSYFDFDIGNDQPSPISISLGQFGQGYPSYYLSPGGSQTAWIENRSEAASLAIGDQAGQNPASIYSGSNLRIFGWYNDEYILVTKNKTLLVLSVLGGKPVKIAEVF